MFVSFWAFEHASRAAFARAPMQDGKRRLMRLDFLVLAKLLAAAEADFAFWLARRACCLAGLDADRVAHVARSAPATRRALKVRARDYFQRFARLEEIACGMAMRMAKLARRAVRLVNESRAPAPVACPAPPLPRISSPMAAVLRLAAGSRPRAPP
jgi:hypothetical protein